MRRSKKKILISIIVALVFFAVFSFLCPYQVFKNIEEFSSQLLSVEAELVSIGEKNNELYNWERELPDLKPDLEKIEELFINLEMPVEFLRFLENLARDNNLSIRVSLLRAGENKDSNAAILQFKVLVDGSFSNCAKFLEKLENAPYLIAVENLIITRVLKGGEESFFEGMQFNLSIKVFGLESDGF